MTIGAGGSFTLIIDPFAFPAASSVNGLVEFGIDIFMDKSADEGMCVEIANKAYIAIEKAKVSPPFVDYCVDEGHGHFKKETIPIVPTPIVSPGCLPPQKTCELEWYYCPRDPGCVTYDMSVSRVELDVQDPTALKAGDKVDLKVDGFTSLAKVPVAGTWRIYDLAGHNAATGLLTDVMSLRQTATGMAFDMNINFTFPAASIAGPDLEFGLDIFMDKSADEGMCIEIANPAYIATVKAKVSPPFVDYCVDEGHGHFKKQTIAIVPAPVICVLENTTTASVVEGVEVVNKYCVSDTDCGGKGYCETYKAPVEVYMCHGATASNDYCVADGDCGGSYCQRGATKKAIKAYMCH